MMNRLTLICILMVVCSPLYAQISTEEAKERASAFLGSHNTNSSRRVKAAGRNALSVETANPSVYAVNVEGGGYVLVANSDLTDPILGYCDEGHFDATDLPDNMRAWLQSYDDQISHFTPHETTTASRPRRAQVVAKTAINPLLKSKWGQGDYTKNKSGNAFNCQTPIINNYHSPTGCVATAMAQVMYYYKYPSNSTVIPSYDAGTYVGTQSSLPATSFNWSAMQNEYTGTDLTNVGTAKAEAVGKLMKYCGWGCQMRYQPTGSFASSGNIATALFKYFGYDGNIERLHRNDFRIKDWEDILYNELTNKRPVLYCGSSTGGAHEFVCDGYDGNGMFHINWGWNGKDDGYFLITLLNPNDTSGAGASATSDGYTASQEAVIGIQKPTGTSINKLMVTSVTSDNNKVYLSIFNKGVNTFDAYVGLCAVDSKNNINVLQSFSNTGNFTPGTGYTGLDYSKTLMANLNDGTYIVTGAYKLKGSSTWQVCRGYEYNYATVTVKSHVITSFTLSNPPYSLSIQSVTINSNGEAKQQQELKVTVKNAGSGEFDGTILMVVDGNSEDLKMAGTSVPAKGTADLYYYFTPATSGTHTLKFYFDDFTTVIGTKSVSIKASSNTTTFSCSFQVNDITDIGGQHYATNTATSGSISVINNTTSEFTETLTLGLYIKQSGSYVLNTSWNYSNLGFKANGKRGLTLPEAYLEKGSQYKWELKTSSSKVIGTYEFFCPDGLICYTADGTASYQKNASSISLNANVTSVDMTLANVYTISTINASNPNCIFYLSSSQTTPSTLNNKNVVKGTTAAKITLTSGYNYGAIRDFTAGTITYTDHFKGSNLSKGGWSTLALPFTASSVSCDGKALTWFKSASESGKNFWLYRYTYENSGKVVFDYVKDNIINGYTPYIIAVPDNTWGSKYNLDGKDIVFSGSNVLVEGNKHAGITGQAYRMVGTFSAIKPTTGYNINAAGDSFVKFSSATNISPFRAYFISLDNNAGSPEKLFIDFAQETATAIEAVSIEKNDLLDNEWYTLQGIRIDRPTQPGIYIHNGKKIHIQK